MVDKGQHVFDVVREQVLNCINDVRHRVQVFRPALVHEHADGLGLVHGFLRFCFLTFCEGMHDLSVFPFLQECLQTVQRLRGLPFCRQLDQANANVAALDAAGDIFADKLEGEGDERLCVSAQDSVFTTQVLHVEQVSDGDLADGASRRTFAAFDTR